MSCGDRRVVLRLDRHLARLGLALELVGELAVRVGRICTVFWRPPSRCPTARLQPPVPFFPIALATYAARASASLPSTRFRRHLIALREGDLLPTTPSMVLRPRPSATDCLNARSRFGPCTPLVPAFSRMWQAPQRLREELLPASGVGLLAASAPGSQEQGPGGERGGDQGARIRTSGISGRALSAFARSFANSHPAGGAGQDGYPACRAPKPPARRGRACIARRARRPRSRRSPRSRPS